MVQLYSNDQGQPSGALPVRLVTSDGTTFYQAGTPPSAGNMTTGQVTVTSSATLLAAARPGRLGLIVEMNGNVAIVVGAGNTTTTGNGLPLPGVVGASLSLPGYTGAVYGISTGASVSVGYAELYA